MAEQFLHGCEVADGIRPIRTVKSSVIGVIGTAPDATDADFPYHTPVLLANNQRKAAKLGKEGTLFDAVSAIYTQTGATIVVVRVPEGADTNETLSNIIGSPLLMTGVHAFRAANSLLAVKPKILIAPGYTSVKPQGVTVLELTEQGEGYTQATVTIEGGGGTGAAAEAVIEQGKITALKLTRAGIRTALDSRRERVHQRTRSSAAPGRQRRPDQDRRRAVGGRDVPDYRHGHGSAHDGRRLHPRRPGEPR